MIKELLLMNGYGIYVWAAFFFALINFAILFLITKLQLTKETRKFVAKFGDLEPTKAKIPKSQSINKEILSNSSNI